MVSRCFEGIEIGLEEGLCFMSMNKFRVLSLESIPMNIELILLEFTVKTRRRLCIGIYRPPCQSEKYFIDHLSKTLGQLTYQYNKTMLIGDFN